MVPEKPGQEVGAGSASSPATQQAPTLTGRCGPCGSRAASAGLSPPGSARPSPPCAGCWPHTACATGLGDPVPPRTHPGQAWPRLTVQRKYGKDQGTRPEKQAPAPACPGRHGMVWTGRDGAERTLRWAPVGGGGVLSMPLSLEQPLFHVGLCCGHAKAAGAPSPAAPRDGSAAPGDTISV